MQTLKQIESIATRAGHSLLADAAGAAALVTLFVLALYIPAIV